ncbi:Fc.00g058410.m01.CDS01 [Cosmosporella sp. VM-42]
MASEKRTPADDLRVESAGDALDHLKNVDLHDKTLNNEALQATVQEHSFGVIQGFKTYKRAAFWSILAEIGSTRLRTQTVVLARSTYYVGNIICGGLIQPKLLAPGAWNAKGKTAFFWAVLATLTWIWGYFRMFETKDRTFGEMDFMFQKGVPARKSAKYQINDEEVYIAEERDQR